MSKNSKQNKKNKNSQKSQKNQAQRKPQNQPKNRQNDPQHSQSPRPQTTNSKNFKQAPSPKSQAEQEYAPLEQKFQINHNSKKSKKRNKKRQNEYSFENFSEPIPNKGLTNLGNSCFANALFQCLYHVTAFRDSIIESEDTSGPLLKSLAHFFQEMNEGSPGVQKAYIELLNTLFAKRSEFQLKVRGDSSILLRALLEELAKENDHNSTPYLHLFNAGELTKSMTCPQPDCSMNKRIRESMKILEVRDINFTLENQNNFFQSSEIRRKCSCSEEKQMFQCEYTASDLPEVLIIRIYDILGSEEAIQVLPNFTLKQDTSRNGCTYEFVAAVMNKQKGEQGIHSVELSLHNNIYYIFDDNQVYSRNFHSIDDLHPKVIFYKKRMVDDVQNLSFIYSQKFETLFQQNPQLACEKDCDSICHVLFMLCQELKAKKNYSNFRKELANFSETLKRSFHRLSHPMETEEHASNREISLKFKSDNEQFASQQQNNPTSEKHKMLQDSEPFSLLEKQSTKTNSSNSHFTSFDSQSLLLNSSDSNKSSENEEKENHKKSNHIFGSPPQVEKTQLNLNESPEYSNKAISLKKKKEESKFNSNQTSSQAEFKTSFQNKETIDPSNSFQKKPNSSSYLNSTSRFSSQPRYKRENLNRGLRNLGLTCYFNSSLQSWYHIKVFRDSVLCATEGAHCTSLFARLQTLFGEMHHDSEYLDDAHEGLIHEIFSAREEQFKLYKKCDSGLLFQALIEELSGERDPKTIPYLKIFLGGSLLKTRECRDCHVEKKIRESIKLFEVRDCDFIKEKMKNYFQPSYETRTCTCTSQQPLFDCSYSAFDLPQILAIRIHDTKNNYEKVRVLEEITFREFSATNSEKEFKDVKYKFVTGIFNTYKGEDGGHSVEISKHHGKYFEFNDLGLDDYSSIDYIPRHPKVLYYQKI